MTLTVGANPITTLAEVQAAIKQSAKYQEEAASYKQSAKKLNELAQSLSIAAGKWPEGTMAVLGWEPGQVRLHPEKGAIAVVVSVWNGGARLQELTTKGHVSTSVDFQAGVSPHTHEQWVATGYTVEPTTGHRPTYDGVLVHAHKRKMKPGPMREPYLTGE